MPIRPSSRESYRLIIIVLVFGLVATGCGSSPQVASTVTSAPKALITLTCSGASTGLSVLEVLRPAFEADNPGYALQILKSASTSGNSGALKGIGDKVLDFGAVTRDLTPEQLASGMDFVEFGREGISAFAHPSASITALTSQQLADIYAGRITNWSAVGGLNLPIVLYVRQPDENVTQKLRDVYLGKTPFPPSAQLLTSSTDIVSAVSGTAGSIGYGGWPAAVSVHAPVNPISIDGIAPTDPQYPVFNRLMIVYMKDRKSDIQPLVAWLVSKRGQDEVAKLGVIPVTPK